MPFTCSKDIGSSMAMNLNPEERDEINLRLYHRCRHVCYEAQVALIP
jgi:hypothetical protein